MGWTSDSLGAYGVFSDALRKDFSHSTLDAYDQDMTGPPWREQQDQAALQRLNDWSKESYHPDFAPSW